MSSKPVARDLYNGVVDGEVTHSLRLGHGEGVPAVMAAVAFAHQAGGTQTALGYAPDSETTPTLAKPQTVAVAFTENQRGDVWEGDVMQPLNRGGGKPGMCYPAIRQAMQVRRLTPRECERLQGFPDDYTLVPHRGKPAADGPRYKALGNSMACNVMQWLGERIQMVEDLLK